MFDCWNVTSILLTSNGVKLHNIIFLCEITAIIYQQQYVAIIDNIINVFSYYV